jgi:hypothetical protein
MRFYGDMTQAQIGRQLAASRMQFFRCFPARSATSRRVSSAWTSARPTPGRPASAHAGLMPG